MSWLPKDPRKIKERISRYERDLRQEQRRFGAIDDSSGKRYLLGPLYLLLDDLPGALKSFRWFERTFPDDAGEPFHTLCWALALYRSGDEARAVRKLGQAMLANLYLIPHLLGLEQADLAIWHSSNWATPAYVQEVSPELLALWDEPAREWARATYHSPKIRQVRARYIEIFEQLKHEPVGPTRSQLVQEASKLETMTDL